MIIESISGVRGLTSSFLTVDSVKNYAYAFHQQCSPGVLFVGRDSRSTGDELQSAVVEELSNCGRDVFICEIVPTPTVQFMVERTEAAGGIVITASHNPKEWNGMKFIRSDGVFLFPKECSSLYKAAKSIHRSNSKEQGMVLHDHNSVQKHIIHQTCLSCIDLNKIREMKFKVVVDACNGAASEALPGMLEALGCDVVPINCNVNEPFPRGTEPLPENLEMLCKKVVESKADAGFATDPDGDRLAVVSERGLPLGEEYSLALAADGLLSSSQDVGSNFVVNLSTSLALEKLSEPHGVSVQYSPVGEINVVRKMLETGAVFGGEGNGGIILKESHLGRDSLTGVTLILNSMALSEKSLSEMHSVMPQFTIVKDKIGIEKKDFSLLVSKLKKEFSDGEINTEDGIKFSWDNSWIHFRKSNTEPIIRIYAEANKNSTARELIQKAKDAIS